jgi:type I restriction-modification system DNA methylase subunit
MKCGYTAAHIKEDYFFGGIALPLVAFATKPWDFDSACIAVVPGSGDPKQSVQSCRDLGAPVVWVPHNGSVDWWVQKSPEPVRFASKPPDQFKQLVLEHNADLSPVSVYRGKTIARVDKSRQLDFVDAGLLPLLRERAGEKLHDLVEEMTRAILDGLGGDEPSKEKLRTAFAAAFRLLTGKILKDKAVPGFADIDLTQPAEVLSAVSRHYNAGAAADVPAGGRWKTSLRDAVSLFAGAGSFREVSPEALAYVYEQTLVTKALRKKLGIHATPPSLVDYIVWRLYDWIREIPEEDRHVFEPACGHAPFLLSAMRLLRLESGDESEADVHAYLKAHIHGLEIDDFAREIARLSLTLADVPNPNGWDLRGGDMFASDSLNRKAARCRILLSNPPYERFGSSAKRHYARRSGAIAADTKSTEMLLRTLPYLPKGGVFGLVVPQGVLHDKESKPVRERLLADFELAEISVFADNLFEHSDHETAVLIGRRAEMAAARARPLYRRVREQGMEGFKHRLELSSEQTVSQRRFIASADSNLLLPDLAEVWDTLRGSPTLGSVAEIQQGFQFLNTHALKKRECVSKTRRAGWVKAILKAADDYSVWELPRTVWIDASPANFRRPGAATKLGIAQVVVNYAPVARQPWRLKAVIDGEGVAVSSRFVVFRRKPNGPSLVLLWAVLNSPIANAYAYCFSGKRETLVKEWRAFQLPHAPLERAQAIESAASAYLALAEGADSAFMRPSTKNDVKQALLALDAEVLKLYDLPPRLERQLLDLFTGVERKGVGCDFHGYYPPGFASCLPLHLVISERFERAAADATAERFKPGESDYVRDVLAAAAAGADED